MMANHGGDHAIYPDCRRGFVDAMSAAIAEGTYDHITILAPYTDITKTDIARRGAALGIDYSHTYSCYKGGEKHCGRCGTCTERRQALPMPTSPTPPIMKIKSLILSLSILLSANASIMAQTIYPSPLKQGDKIAILAPAGPIKPAPVDSAAKVLKELGYEPVIYPHTFGEFGHFSGTHDERFLDLASAFTDPEIRAILCARGGYGVVHNLDKLSAPPLTADPKWVIGFSDISALHALMASKDIASIHSSMAKQVALGPDNDDNARLLPYSKASFQATPSNPTSITTPAMPRANCSAATWP